MKSIEQKSERQRVKIHADQINVRHFLICLFVCNVSMCVLDVRAWRNFLIFLIEILVM